MALLGGGARTLLRGLDGGRLGGAAAGWRLCQPHWTAGPGARGFSDGAEGEEQSEEAKAAAAAAARTQHAAAVAEFHRARTAFK